MARTLVIGGNGFLGSHLVDELAAAGHDVAVFDRFSTPRSMWDAPDVERIAGDFLDTEGLRRAVTGRDLVFHFLSTTTPLTADADPTVDLKTNVAQSVELFSIAADAGVSRLFFASTGGAIYGEHPEERIAEDALPSPVSPYAIGKQAIEGYLRYFQRTHGLASTSFRISNPYGPRQHAGRRQGVIPIFLQRIAAGLPIDVLGDGSAVRDYLFASDAARLIAATVGSEPRHEVYNVGSGRGTTLDEVLSLAAEITGKVPEIRRLPQPATFIDRVVLDTNRYSIEFGLPDLIDLRDGIERTWHAILAERS